MPTRLFDMIMSSTNDLTASGVMMRLALLAASMFATIHMLSLWGTKYGDNNTSAKSFFLSLVLHVCFGLGWVTVAESYPRRMIGIAAETTQTAITFVDTDDVAPQTGTNKLPIFNSGPVNSASLLSRDPRGRSKIDRDAQTPELDSPEIDKSPVTTMEPELPDFATQEDELAPGLEQSTSAASSPSKAATSSTSAIDEPTPVSRPDVSAAATSRPKTARSAESGEMISAPRINRGAASRQTPLIEEGATMAFSAENDSGALPKPQGPPSNDAIRRPGSPDPTDVVDSSAGSGADGTRNNAGTSGPRRQQRIPRSSNQTGDGSDDMSTRPTIASRPASIGRPTDDAVAINRSLSNETFDESQQPTIVKSKTPSMSRAPARAPETYQARSLGQRMANVLKHGGSEESEKAVENSLKWLASVQERNGSWSSAKYGGGVAKSDPQEPGIDRKEGGKFADTGVTGLVLLSFLGAGYTHERGPYTAEVRLGIDWLISRQQTNGYLCGNATHYDQNYCHAMATFALAEAYAMQKDGGDFPELRTAVERGVQMISDLQNDDGGWRYGRREKRSDMSMFGWQLMALKSAVNGGIPVQDKTLRKMVKFLESQSLGEFGGLAAYRTAGAEGKPTPAMTAEALFCRQMFIARTNDEASQEAATYLRKHLPRVTEYDEYYWYYGTLAMHNLDNEQWLEWNDSLRDMLISMQRQDGPLAGSWEPRGKWAGIGGRLYSTALSTLCLEVYYRYATIAKPENSR